MEFETNFQQRARRINHKLIEIDKMGKINSRKTAENVPQRIKRRHAGRLS